MSTKKQKESDQTVSRCSWCGNDPLYISYHDEEWGVPVFDERQLFEMLSLEGAQAGLSWITILRKREYYRSAFDNFEVGRIAAYNESHLERLLKFQGIVHNRLKLSSVIHNARLVLALGKNSITFSDFLWSFTDGKRIHSNFETNDELPTSTKESHAMSRALKKHGFKFVGPIICYSFMQAVGMVNDHVVSCFRHNQLQR